MRIQAPSLVVDSAATDLEKPLIATTLVAVVLGLIVWLQSLERQRRQYGM